MNEPASTSTEPSTGLPRLGILHIMLWTAICAAQIAPLRWLYGRQDVPGSLANNLRATGSIHAIIAGAQITGACVLLWTRIKGRRLQIQPGHWLLCIQSAITVVNLGIYMLVLLVFAENGKPPIDNLWLVVFFGLLYLAMSVAYVIAAWLTQPWRWKTVMLALGVISILQSAAYSIGISMSIGLLSRLTMLAFYAQFAVSFWIIAVAVWDIAKSERRDWLHWVGVVTCVARVHVSLLQLLWQSLISW